ncbi:uncharacterized protein [Onthophagus taurus]|uniref:uncharacterized protein n=1 Tax=Onthophagus taurus TaxID=166361 RepID=UPI0039BE9292
MYPIPDWPTESQNLYERLQKSQHLLGNLENVALNSNLEHILQLSEEFPIPFPLQTGRCKTIKETVSSEKLEHYINSVYPLLHENVLLLYLDFLIFKKEYGSDVEKKLYETMTVADLVDRFLKIRAVTFMGKFDDYLLLNGTKGRGNWESIGIENDDPDINLENCLSYDEIKLSALLSVSSYTYFVNNGQRSNKGMVPKSRNNIQNEGVIIGLIGARLRKKNVMEYQEIVYSKDQNKEKNGYGVVFKPSFAAVMAKFYGKDCLTYGDFLKSKTLKEPGYFNEISKGVYFDNITYSKRMILSIDTLLYEANHRAKNVGKFAYIHVVGIGLGVWKCSVHQEELFMETFAKRLEVLSKHLHSISDIHFAYFSTQNCAQYTHGSKIPCDSHPNGGIVVYITNREPHTKLTSPHDEKLLVVSYAWDGNALPGNEYWLGKTSSTGDSAAASSTQIAELHNPHINKNVCGRNLHIACKDGVLPFKTYFDDVVSKKKKGFGDELGNVI